MTSKFFRPLLFTVLCSAVLLCAVATSFAQEDTLKIETTLVRLNIGAVDAKGGSITNLNRNDFTVYENDVKQTVSRFETTNAPFSLVMLLDVSGSTRGFRQLMAQSAIRFTDALAPEDRVAVIAFNNKTEVLVDFTSKQKDIYYAIGLVNANSKSGETQLYKALDVALDKLKGEGNRRKAIVVLTDGIDTQLEADDRRVTGNAKTAEDALALIKPDTNQRLKTMLDAADRQGVTIYPLGLPSGDPKRLPDPLPFQLARYTAARERLQVVANRTGGSFNAINRLEDMGRLYASVAAEIRTLYTVEYQSTSDAPRGKWRTIRIEVNRPEVIAKTRPGYFAR